MQAHFGHLPVDRVQAAQAALDALEAALITQTPEGNPEVKMTAPAAVLPSANLSQREKMLAFVGILTVLFLSSLNLTVVGSAMPRVISDLGGFHLYAWAFTAYSLATTITIPIVGTISDRWAAAR